MAKPFWKPLRPDDPKARPRHFTVSGYIVDQWKMMAMSGVVVGLLGAGIGGYGMWWGMTKEIAPPKVLPVLLDRTGRVARATYTTDDKDAEEDLINATLAELVWHVRTLTPDRPIQKQIFQRADSVFRGVASMKIRKFMEYRKWYKEEIARGYHRVVEMPINARRVPGTPDIYRVDWVEQLFQGNGQPVPGGRKEQYLEGRIVKVPDLDPELRTNNPAGIFLEDFSWSVTD